MIMIIIMITIIMMIMMTVMMIMIIMIIESLGRRDAVSAARLADVPITTQPTLSQSNTT
jgi:hypothetical protein